MTFFVSYANKDEKWAKWVVWELGNAKQRYRLIAQFKDFAPGMNFVQRMRKAAEAESTLALFSPQYFQSNYGQQELDAALTGTSNRLLPVRIAPCDPGPFLQNRIHIDLVDKSTDEAREALLSGVEAYLSLTLKAKEDRGLRTRPIYPGGPRSQEQQPAAAPMQEAGHPLKVLFLAPEVGGLSPRRQLREMQNGAAEVHNSTSIRFKGVFRVHVNTLFEELNRESPHVFHFSGKQSGGDILMRTETGMLTAVSDTVLAGMFQSLDQGLRLVIIDTCHSLRCASRVAKVVPCAIGVEGSPYEDDTIVFFKVFYQAVASGRSLKDAVAQARTALKFAKVPNVEIPQLICRPDVDAAGVFLVDSKRSSRPHNRA